MKKIKHWLTDDRIFFSILLVVVGVTAFGLGRLSVYEAQSHVPTSGVRQLQAALPRAATAPGEVTEEVVASKNGTRYYYQHCSGIERINAENLVSFATADAAEAAGYTLALTCSQ